MKTRPGNGVIGKAFLKGARISPRKCRLVIDLIRGVGLERAKSILRLTRKKAAPMILKLLKSAESNLKNGSRLEPSSFRVSLARVGAGPMTKRFMPRAQGRATPILKRTSHIWLEITES